MVVRRHERALCNLRRGDALIFVRRAGFLAKVQYFGQRGTQLIAIPLGIYAARSVSGSDVLSFFDGCSVEFSAQSQLVIHVQIGSMIISVCSCSPDDTFRCRMSRSMCFAESSGMNLALRQRSSVNLTHKLSGSRSLLRTLVMQTRNRFASFA